MEDMEKRLYDAALLGNANALLELLQEDDLALDRVSLIFFRNYTPLHIAAMRGNLDVVRGIVAHSAELSLELDSRQKSTPLHIASAKGHLEIVQTLVNAKRDVCWAVDRDGRNPLHLAAMNGKVEVLKALLDSSPLAALEKTNRGETVLHLCIKYKKLEALTALVETIDNNELLNEKNADGLTILHLAVISQQIEVIRYLLNTKINVNVKNANGKTALDILQENVIEKKEIEMSLRTAGALTANEITTSSSLNGTTRPNTVLADANSGAPNDIIVAADAQSTITPSPSTQGADLPSNSPQRSHVDGTAVVPLPSRQEANTPSNFTEGKWLKQQSKDLMVVASLIATIAFQAAVSPAGGVWQDDLSQDSQGNPVPNPHTAGQSVMAYHHLTYYKFFLRTNTTAFVSSLSTILLLLSGLPFRHKFFMWILMVVMWLTATSIAATYSISLAVITPKTDWEQLGHVIEVFVIVWSCLITIVLLGKTFFFIPMSLKERAVSICRLGISRNSAVGNHGNGNQVVIPVANHQL